MAKHMTSLSSDVSGAGHADFERYAAGQRFHRDASNAFHCGVHGYIAGRKTDTDLGARVRLFSRPKIEETTLPDGPPCRYYIVTESGAVSIDDPDQFDQTALFETLAAAGVTIEAVEPVLFCVAPAQSISRLVTNHGALMLSQEFEGMCSGVLLYSESGRLPAVVYSALQASASFVEAQGPRT